MPSPSKTEIEARLLVTGSQREAVFQRVRERARVGDLPCAAFELLELADAYFDLPNDELATRQCALRLRRETRGAQTRTLLAFKGPARSMTSHCSERFELEGLWPGTILQDIVQELRERGLACAESVPDEGDPLDRLAQLGLLQVQSRCTRRERALLTGQGGPVAELCLDQVQYQLVHNLVLHREIEIEALGGTTASQVLELAAELKHSMGPALLPWRWSKTALGRALETLEHEEKLAHHLNGSELEGEGYEQVDSLLRKD